VQTSDCAVAIWSSSSTTILLPMAKRVIEWKCLTPLADDCRYQYAHQRARRSANCERR
jgi:hypothetical protein